MEAISDKKFPQFILGVFLGVFFGFIGKKCQMISKIGQGVKTCFEKLKEFIRSGGRMLP